MHSYFLHPYFGRNYKRKNAWARWDSNPRACGIHVYCAGISVRQTDVITTMQRAHDLG